MVGLSHADFRTERLDLFWWFITERQLIWRRRNIEKRPPPWTDDPTMQVERFTNVYRELDPGTRYAVDAILEQDAPKPDKVFNVMFYRLVGRPESHATVGFMRLEDFDVDLVRAALRRVRELHGVSPFTTAYMVSAYASLGSREKIENVARLFGKLHQRFAGLYDRIERAAGPEEIHQALASEYGFGTFLAYQVFVDLTYAVRVYGGAPLLPYSQNEWASAGPGARRGVSMLLSDGCRQSHLEVMRWLQQNQRDEFARLGLDFPFVVEANGAPRELTLANIQNCLCEFHKYVKIRDGTGRGRRKFASVESSGSDQLRLPLPVIAGGANDSLPGPQR